MRDTFFTWITFQGEPIPSVCALLLVIAGVVLVRLSYRVSTTPALPETRKKSER